MDVTFHFDPMCPWTWVTSRWLLRAAEIEDLQVGWAPFSLSHIGGKAEGREGTRIVQHLLAIDEPERIARFYDALGDRSFRKGNRPDAEDVVQAARDAGLDDADIAAAHDHSLDEAVEVATDLAMASAGPDIGSPVLHWTDDHAEDVWIFGPLFDRAPDPPCAAELWRGVRHLAVHAMFKELKRGRTGPPDLSTT
jgi:2-hydroxychromene-2-carboxylate isomerase